MEKEEGWRIHDPDCQWIEAGGNLPLRVLICRGEHAHTCTSTRIRAPVRQQPLGTGMLFWGADVLGGLGRGGWHRGAAFPAHIWAALKAKLLPWASGFQTPA